MRIQCIFLLLATALIPQVVLAQAPPIGTRTSPGQSVDRSQAVDSTARYVTAFDLYEVKTVEKDSLNYFSHHYDPARKTRLQYTHLGNLGSAHRRVLYDFDETKGLHIGQHQYGMYQRRFEDFRFYEAESALTEFDYSQGLDQLDGILTARFGRNFADGVKASVDYTRINNKGAFTHQRGKHTTFGFGVWYDAPDGRYDGLFHYGSNSAVQEDNGGIIDYAELDSQQLTANVPVHLTDALTTNRERAISVQNHFHLNPANDSITPSTLVDVIHTGAFKSGFVRFSDADISNDLDYFGDFVVDSRGVRHFIDYSTLDNRIDLQFRFAAGEGRHHRLKAGLQYRRTTLEQEPETRVVNETFLNAEGKLWLTPALSLTGNGYIALTGQSGDFMLKGALNYALNARNQLAADLTLYSRSPYVLEEKLYVAQLPVWNNEFGDVTHTRLNVVADFTEQQFVLRGSAHLVDNAIYYNSSRLPVQLDDSQEVLQLYAQKALRVGSLGLDVSFALQSGPEVFALPTWLAGGQLYYQGRWFKQRLLVRTGIDLRVTDDFNGINYFPLTGQFHLDDSRGVDLYPGVDLFFTMQVKETFRAFFKVENATSFVLDDPFYQVVAYPQFEGYFRLGLWMKLFD